jgi:cyanophycinase-like exopeptidase
LDVVRVEDAPAVVVDAHADSRAAPTRIMRALRITQSACHSRSAGGQPTCRPR